MNYEQELIRLKALVVGLLEVIDATDVQRKQAKEYFQAANVDIKFLEGK